MNKFAERLKFLREERKLTMTALAKEVGYTHVAITRWENQTRIPNIDTLIVFAKFFEVSTDYLLGLED